MFILIQQFLYGTITFIVIIKKTACFENIYKYIYTFIHIHVIMNQLKNANIFEDMYWYAIYASLSTPN